MKSENNFLFGGDFFSDKLNFGFINLNQVCEVALNYENNVPAHKQVCNEITYIVSGQGVFRTGNKTFSVKQGDIHVIAEGDIHEIHVPPSQKLRYMCIGFDFGDISEEYREICEFYRHSPETVCSSDSDLKYLFEMLIREFYVIAEHHDCVVENLLKLILPKVKRCFERKEQHGVPERGISKQSTIYKIVKYIDDNIDSIASIGEISKELHYTESYISTLFQRTMGVTLQTYVREKRLETAKVLLQYGNRTVDEVVMHMNYSSTQSFSKSFKKKYGITPHQYVISVR